MPSSNITIGSEPRYVYGGGRGGGSYPYSPGPGYGGGSIVTLSDYPGVAQMMQDIQKGANYNRIPLEPELESQSSSDIMALLNPGNVFPDVARRSAELGAARGIPGSAAAWGTGLRMTDEERLRRIALGENLLSGAAARNPTAPLPPVGDFIYQGGRGYGGYGGGGGGGGGPTIRYPGGVGGLNPPSVGGGPAFPGYPAVGGSSGTAAPGTGLQWTMGDVQYGGYDPLIDSGGYDPGMVNLGYQAPNWNPYGGGDFSGYDPSLDIPGGGDAENMGFPGADFGYDGNSFNEMLDSLDILG